MVRPKPAIAEDLLGHADAVFNIAGATRLAEEGLKVGRMVYIGTDPVLHELRFANGEASVQSLIDEHDDVVTYGENIGRPDCRIPALPRLRATMRQPVLLDLWAAGPASRHVFTTVGNWKQGGEIEFHGETYFWSKDRELRKIIDLPARVGRAHRVRHGPRSTDACGPGSARWERLASCRRARVHHGPVGLP